ncbi:MAG: AmmeMemoRadiSam system protein B [Candidatus Thermoplasmatota archaeon]|nr:AmmeMemoRadiSam system protein B [Candidatus Thermoplasmatota archaeon]
MRRAVASGRFYPSRSGSLRRELDRCFKDGPGRNRPSEGTVPIGVISPHAGYTFSGPTAAQSFMAMADGGFPDTIIFLGPNHTGMGKRIGMSDEDWETPLGTMELDRDLMDVIDVPIDRACHVQEHSIEVQMPFVQYFDGSIKQICISMMDQSLVTARDIGSLMAKVLRSGKKRIGLVASSDFTHCGYAYGYPVPPGMTPGEFARSRDLPVIESLEEFDLDSALRKKEELGTTACGLGPIAAVIEASKQLGAERIKVLDYTTSYDIDPSDLAVGYASMVIY